MLYKQVQIQQLKVFDRPLQQLTYIYLLRMLSVDQKDHTKPGSFKSLDRGSRNWGY